MVTMLAIRPKVRGFKPGQGDGFIKATKICRPSFREEVKLENPCHKILWYVKKITRKYEQKYFARPNSSFPSPVPPASY
jgi:hypothetical protein